MIKKNSVVNSGATVLYEGSCIQIQPPNPGGGDDVEPCVILDILAPVCAALNGQLIDYNNVYEARCAYVSLLLSVLVFLLLSVSVCAFATTTTTSGLGKSSDSL